ncbi:SGNH hydrolase-type esterase domain-containing protein [Naematelia encephala]|uniref:SGNH hydrolase-type esterase domain-containing protein n=1 Tax=Naematelia encephala TaxID=71784 RepID=A0A1Y2B101_9TREE|nr:SGNH hydrolase-type esterase domain-containing protein [Naematelia encephala]
MTKRDRIVHDQPHEMSGYPPSSADNSTLSQPLLSSDNDDTSPPSFEPARRRHSTPTLRRRFPGLYLALKKWWKPLIALSTPFFLLFLYALIHPHYPSLPALPKVRIDTTGSNSHIFGHSDAGPFECTCGESVAGERLCRVYNQEGLRSSQLVKGTGARVRKVLQKAREGHSLKVGVLGGSVSACRGVHPSVEHPRGDPAGPGCYTSLFKDWLNQTFPGSEHQVWNGAIGGMDSSYYAFCGAHHIANDVDLIILEFDVNDQTDTIYASFFDQLLRVLLEFKSQPAVVILGMWAPLVAQDQGYGDPQWVHLPIAHYYDIPYVSMKRIIFNHYLRYPESTAKAFYQIDHLHPNARGHRVLSDLLISYLESELCLLSRYGMPAIPPLEETMATEKASNSLVSIPFPFEVNYVQHNDPTSPPDGWEASFDPIPLASMAEEARHFALPETPYRVPPVAMFLPLSDVVDPGKPDPTSARHVLGLPQPKPFCADANYVDNPLKPASAEGWEQYVWDNEKRYWVSKTVGARIRVDIKVNEGRVAVYYFRSQHYELGDMLCWVDDNERGAVNLPGYWDKEINVAVVAYIDEKVTPGNHYVTCEVSAQSSHPNMENHNVRLAAVMAT